MAFNRSIIPVLPLAVCRKEDILPARLSVPAAAHLQAAWHSSTTRLSSFQATQPHDPCRRNDLRQCECAKCRSSGSNARVSRVGDVITIARFRQTATRLPSRFWCAIIQLIQLSADHGHTQRDKRFHRRQRSRPFNRRVGKIRFAVLACCIHRHRYHVASHKHFFQRTVPTPPVFVRPTTITTATSPRTAGSYQKMPASSSG